MIDEAERENCCPLSMLSMPSKILESCVSDMVTTHVFKDNQGLVSDKQWTYRKGFSIELLLSHIMEIWRHAIDKKLAVGAAFIDFQQAFNSVSHPILLN